MCSASSDNRSDIFSGVSKIKSYAIIFRTSATVSDVMIMLEITFIIYFFEMRTKFSAS